MLDIGVVLVDVTFLVEEVVEFAVEVVINVSVKFSITFSVVFCFDVMGSFIVIDTAVVV